MCYLKFWNVLEFYFDGFFILIQNDINKWLAPKKLGHNSMPKLSVYKFRPNAKEYRIQTVFPCFIIPTLKCILEQIIDSHGVFVTVMFELSCLKSYKIIQLHFLTKLDQSTSLGVSM